MFRTRKAKRQNATFDDFLVELFQSFIQSTLRTLILVENAGRSSSEKSFEAVEEFINNSRLPVTPEVCCSGTDYIFTGADMI